MDLTLTNKSGVNLNNKSYSDEDSQKYTVRKTGNLIKKSNIQGSDYVYDANGTMLYYKVVLNDVEKMI